jgi:hypothetical protein
LKRHSSNKHLVDLRIGPLMPSFLPCGKAGGLQILRCQGLAVIYYGCALGALTLKPSGFSNIGVYLKEGEFNKNRKGNPCNNADDIGFPIGPAGGHAAPGNLTDLGFT